jgi:hypothetical protein
LVLALTLSRSYRRLCHRASDLAGNSDIRFCRKSGHQVLPRQRQMYRVVRRIALDPKYDADMATPYPIRLALWQCHKAGMDAPSLAIRFGLPGRTVRNLLDLFRCEGQPFPPSLPRQPRT